MRNSPAEKNTRKIKGLNDLMNDNKFVLFLSLVIAFLVWMAVAMYASPEESYTIYNIPITVNTENSLVSQKGYKNFWQSDTTVDVTVTGPRYLITTLTPEDIIASANLNTVDSAGISELSLNVKLKQESQDITISQQSKTTIEVYFDAELQKDVSIYLDKTVFEDKIADGFLLNSVELPVTTVSVIGPETEVSKIVRAVADPKLPDEFIYETSTLPIVLNLEGNTATDTVNANNYVGFVNEQEYFVKVNIDRVVDLEPAVEFTGIKSREFNVDINTDTIIAKIDTQLGYDSETLTIMTIDYSELTAGENVFTVKASDVELPDGIKLPDEEFEFVITITLVA